MFLGGKVSPFLSNLRFASRDLDKETFAAHSVTAGPDVSDGPDSAMGLPGLEDLLFYSQSYPVSPPS